MSSLCSDSSVVACVRGVPLRASLVGRPMVKFVFCKGIFEMEEIYEDDEENFEVIEEIVLVDEGPSSGI